MADFKETPFAVWAAPDDAGAPHPTTPTPSHFSITLHHVSVNLPDGRTLLDALNGSFHAEHTGLVGRNGIGKSVLAQTLVGLVQPDSGRVMRQGRVAYVPQHIRVPPSATVADLAAVTPWLQALERVEQGRADVQDFELLQGRWDMQTRLMQALARSGLNGLQPSHPAATLSGGEACRVALIGALLCGADGLVLDEPTNHLDRPARHWLYGQLQQWRGGLLVLSHDRELLDTMQRTVELTPSGLHSYGGNYNLYRTQCDLQAQAAHAAWEHARVQRASALRALRQQHDAQQSRTARNQKSARNANQSSISLGRLKEGAQNQAGREHQRQQNARAELDEAVRQAAQGTEAAPVVALMLPSTALAANKRVLHLEDAVSPFPAHCQPVSLTLNGPVRVAVQGPSGCGKTSLLRMLAGDLAPLSGRSECGVPCAWLDQHAVKLLPLDRSVLAQLDALHTPLPQGVLRSHLACLGLRAEQLQCPSGQLSGGERLKAALACALWGAQAAQLLLLDEPTNHLDLDAVRALEQALSAYGGALVVVSHDMHFLQALNMTHSLQLQGKTWALEAWDGPISLRQAVHEHNHVVASTVTKRGVGDC